jgi:LysR family cys regulon transcriptional activator
MELRQLRSLVTLVETGFNVSHAAQQLNLVQPAVSQHLKQLEQELGAQLFQRHGKRLVGLTETGEKVVHYARRTLADARNIIEAGRDERDQENGILRLGTTHTQARYVLPPVVRKFSALYPKVELQIFQGTPARLIELAIQDRVDLVICTEALSDHPALSAVPCIRWNRCLIAPHDHPLAEQKSITLEALCQHPIITYVAGFTGRGHLSETFGRAGLQPQVVLSATDTDVIKTYVRENMGVGIIAELAYQPESDSDLARRSLEHLFPWEITKIAHLREKYLRRFHHHFIELFREISAESGYPLSD